MNFKEQVLSKKILIIILFVYLSNYIFFSFRFFQRFNPYIAADWLINYQGGFTRRGFLGEISLQLSNVLNFSLINIAFFFNFIFSLFFVIYFYLINKNKINLIYFLFLISPLTLSFTIYDPFAVGRKEILILFYFCFYIYCQKKNFIFKNYLLILFAFFFTLTHELFAFYIIYIFFIKYFFIKNNNIKLYNIEIIIFLSSLLSLFLIYSFGYYMNSDLMCNSLIEKGINPIICIGTINDYKNSSLNILKPITEYFESFNYYSQYFRAYLLGIIPVLLILKLNDDKIKNNFIIFFLILPFIITIPIFLVTNDWGRYINIHFMIYLIFFSQINIINNLFLKKLNIISTFIIFIIYALFWHMPHCCQKDLGKGIFSIKERIFFRITDNHFNTIYGEDKILDFIKNNLIYK
jgi:hypothetical protein